MAKKQSRASISFNRALWYRIREEAALDGKSESHWIASLVVAELAKRGRPFAGTLSHVPPSVVARMREHRTARRLRKLGVVI